MSDGYHQRLNASLHSPRGAAFHGRSRTSHSHTVLCTTRSRPRPQRLCLDSQLHRSSYGMRHKLPRKSLWQRGGSPIEENFVGTISLFRLDKRDSIDQQHTNATGESCTCLPRLAPQLHEVGFLRITGRRLRKPTEGRRNPKKDIQKLKGTKFTCFMSEIQLQQLLRMQHLGQNKEDLCYPVYLFRFASKGKSAVFIFLMTKSNMA